MEIFQNGTLWLKMTEEVDEGMYTVNVHEENGKIIYWERMKVFVTGFVFTVPQPQVTKFHEHDDISQDPKAFFMTENNQMHMSVFSGDSVILHISRDLGKINDIIWKKEKQTLIKLKNQMVAVSTNSNAEMFLNGSLRLGKMSVNDSGMYTVDVFDENGRNVLKNSVFLVVFDNTQLAFLGAPVFLYPQNITLGTASIEWKKGDVLLGQWNVTHHVSCFDRIEIFQNGTLKIKRTEEVDEGIYRMDMFDKDGSKICSELIKLNVTDSNTILRISSSDVIYGIFRHVVAVILLLLIILGLFYWKGIGTLLLELQKRLSKSSHDEEKTPQKWNQFDLKKIRQPKQGKAQVKVQQDFYT
ncbi:T-cell surface antigen CD2 isoform X1 [Polypterus senegalus]|uniref:T-cell surface antigen CD2 isoform X1 n=1 Tax=Polypterus senegalus TaxID=55291 RepID=UPI001965A6CF|nr:T-cell surface antigen CD2 isoform X1 [Polypterus senegalus]XP_039631968.1 T-cell surface antigen CD2 isoform X1 [Polypterus senegalus]